MLCSNVLLQDISVSALLRSWVLTVKLLSAPVLLIPASMEAHVSHKEETSTASAEDNTLANGKSTCTHDPRSYSDTQPTLINS